MASEGKTSCVPSVNEIVVSKSVSCVSAESLDDSVLAPLASLGDPLSVEPPHRSWHITIAAPARRIEPRMTDLSSRQTVNTHTGQWRLAISRRDMTHG